MAPSTAISFILLGGMLLSLTRRSLPGVAQGLLSALAILVSLFGALEVAGHFIGEDLNFEDALVPMVGTLGEIPLARMSPSTGAAFFLAGLAALPLLLPWPSRIRRTLPEHWAGCMGSLVLVFAFVFCLAYLHGTPLLYGQGATIPMALTTALGFLMLGIATVCASGRDAIPLRLVLGSSTRSYLLRVFLTLTSVSTLVGSLLVLRVTRVIEANPVLVSASTAVLTALVTGIITIWIARRVAGAIARSEAARDKAMASLRQYEHIVSNSSDMLALLNTDYVYLAANEAYWLAFEKTRDQVVGHAVSDVLGDEFFEATIRPNAERCLGGEEVHSQEWFEFAARGRRWMDILYSPYVAPDGQVIGFVVNARDLTERKRAEVQQLKLERQVQHAQKLESLGVLAGGIAHDFNNLLMGVLGNADLALDKLSPHAPARPNIQDIEIAAKRAANLARQMLAYSGKGRFVIEPIALNEFVDETAHLLELSISKKAVLNYSFAQDLPTFDGDATQISQIIMNLITNASEAIGDRSGVITLSTGAMDCDRAYFDAADGISQTSLDQPLSEGLYVYLEVADTGCGMDEGTLERVFDPFFTTKFAGRGLGMSATLGIVRSHQGVLRIYSDVGKGTTIKVLFPASEVPERGSAVARKRDKGVTNGWQGKGTVLVVDDEETVRAVAKQMLERAGFDVLTAADGREGTEVFREHADEIAGVLLDLTMPRMDGEETCREMRRIRADVKVILCSGYSAQDVAARFAGKGLTGFLQKPFTLEALKESLRALLG